MYCTGMHLFIEQFFVILQSLITPHFNLCQICICSCKTIHTTPVVLHRCGVCFSPPSPPPPSHCLITDVFSNPAQYNCRVQFNMQNILHMPSSICLGNYEIKLEAQYCD